MTAQVNQWSLVGGASVEQDQEEVVRLNQCGYKQVGPQRYIRYVLTHMYTGIHTRSDANTAPHAHIHACNLQKCMHMLACTHSRTCMHMHACTHMHTHARMHVHACTCRNTCMPCACIQRF